MPPSRDQVPVPVPVSTPTTKDATPTETQTAAPASELPRPSRPQPETQSQAPVPLPRRPGVRKPILYIFSPSDIDVSVTVTLTQPELRFSALYPVVPVKRPVGGGGEQIHWSVRTRTRTDGTLFHPDTALEISYLYWEAVTKENALLSPPHSPILDHPPSLDYFNPLFPHLHDSNSVLLPVDNNITLYLDKALSHLGLHTEARTSFISFWLPELLKHEYVALRFLPQPAYQRFAPLNIDPKPHVLTRVFMLYKAVAPACVHSDWPTAVARASEDVSWWKDVVQVDTSDRVHDPTLFRVLEWGGMEAV